MKYRCKRCRALLSKPQLATHLCPDKRDAQEETVSHNTYEFTSSPSIDSSPFIVETNSSDNTTSGGGGTYDGGGASGDW